MFKGLLFFIIIIFIFLFNGCEPDNNPSAADDEFKNVRYYGFIIPIDSADVFRSFTYTNESGGRSQSGVNCSDGSFSKTLKLKSGTLAEFSGTGYTPKSIDIGGRVVIYVNDIILAESNADGRRNTNTVTVTARIP